MSAPLFLHILSTGDIWVTNDAVFTPSGTILATYRVNSDVTSQKIGTISGNSGSYAASGSTGKNGKEKV